MFVRQNQMPIVLHLVDFRLITCQSTAIPCLVPQVAIYQRAIPTLGSTPAWVWKLDAPYPPAPPWSRLWASVSVCPYGSTARGAAARRGRARA